MQSVQDRITTLIEARRPWVVTESYVGPDRRQNDRTESDPVPTFAVPNTVQRKARQDGITTLADDIEEAWQRIELQQMKRHAFQVAFLANLAGASATPARPAGFIFELERIPVVLKDLLSRAQSPSLADTLNPLAIMVIEKISDAVGDPNRLAAEQPEVSAISLEILRLCLGVTDGTKARAEVLRSVQGFLMRVRAS
jgi:hypothetical protein